MKRFAVLQLSGCSGCEVALLNAEEWIDQFDLEYMTLVMSAYDIPEIEVLLVTGGVRTEQDLYKLQRAVRRADEVIAVGTCAISGGVASLGNRAEVREEFLSSTGRYHLPHMLPKCHPIDSVVKVDRYLPGCPPTPQLFMAVLSQDSDFKVAKTVCQECSRKKLKDMRPSCIVGFQQGEVLPDVCLINQGYLCIGASTRGGCQALCTNPGSPCVVGLLFWLLLSVVMLVPFSIKTRYKTLHDLTNAIVHPLAFVIYILLLLVLALGYALLVLPDPLVLPPDWTGINQTLTSWRTELDPPCSPAQMWHVLRLIPIAALSIFGLHQLSLWLAPNLRDKQNISNEFPEPWKENRYIRRGAALVLGPGLVILLIPVAFGVDPTFPLWAAILTVIVLAIGVMVLTGFFLRRMNKRIFSRLEKNPFEVTKETMDAVEDQVERSQADYVESLSGWAKFVKLLFQPRFAGRKVQAVIASNFAEIEDTLYTSDGELKPWKERPVVLVHTIEGAHCLHGQKTCDALKDARKRQIHHRVEQMKMSLTDDEAALENGPPPPPQPDIQYVEQIADVWVTEAEWIKIRDDVIENLDFFYEKGVSCIGLGHWEDNAVTSSAFSYPEGHIKIVDPARWSFMHKDVTRGLTKIGEQVIRRMLELGIIIDVTHASPAARSQVYDIVDNYLDEDSQRVYRVMASHVGAYSLAPLAYNLKDWEIEWLAAHKGVIGVMVSEFYLDGRSHNPLGLRFIENTVAYITDLIKEQNISLVAPGEAPTGPDDTYDTNGSGSDIAAEGCHVIGFGSDFDGMSEPPDDIALASHWPRITQRLEGDLIGVELPRFSWPEVKTMLGQNAYRMLKYGWLKDRVPVIPFTDPDRLPDAQIEEDIQTIRGIVEDITAQMLSPPLFKRSSE